MLQFQEAHKILSAALTLWFKVTFQKEKKKSSLCRSLLPPSIKAAHMHAEQFDIKSSINVANCWEAVQKTVAELSKSIKTQGAV